MDYSYDVKQYDHLNYTRKDFLCYVSDHEIDGEYGISTHVDDPTIEFMDKYFKMCGGIPNRGHLCGVFGIDFKGLVYYLAKRIPFRKNRTMEFYDRNTPMKFKNYISFLYFRYKHIPSSDLIYLKKISVLITVCSDCPVHKHDRSCGHCGCFNKIKDSL